MDAVRLIKATRHALAEARTASDVMVEAWQACRLAEAVGQTSALVLTERALTGGGCGAVEIARALAEAASHAAECIGRPPDEPVTGERASRLTALADLGGTLRELRSLIQEAAESLLVVACGADEQELYWSCVDGVDAAHPARELLTELLRAVGAEDADGAEEAAEETAKEAPQAERLDEPGPVGVGSRELGRAVLGPAAAVVRLEPPTG
ncbi:hypothetical protein ABH940_001964 [Streptacidiphilus sp. BW17]|uniref:DUF6099 family protein n=1 Tax=Streptacidiphilus sp. BW17 TaxID=3156274 RepID=UPI003514F93A